MKKMRGFTFLELMVVIVIMSIVVAWGIPNLNTLTANSRMMSAANDLIGGFQKARSEAITRSVTITIQATDGKDWSKGWTIVDNNTATPTVINTHEAMGGNIKMTATGATVYTYNPAGRLVLVANDTISFCDNRSGMTGRTITLYPIGRVSIATSACP